MKRHVLGAPNALKSARNHTKCTPKHAKNGIYRIAKSLESQGCVGSNPSRSAILQGFRASEDFDARLFFCLGVVYGVVLYG